MAEEIKDRKVGMLLFTGILLYPLFSLLTLRKGYSKGARIVSLSYFAVIWVGWIGMNMIVEADLKGASVISSDRDSRAYQNASR